VEAPRRLGLQTLGVLAVVAAAVVWARYGGPATARELRRAFDAFDPVVVLELAVGLVVVGVAASLWGGGLRRKLTIGGRLPRIPTAVVLAAITSLAAVFRIVLGAEYQLPTVFGDELIYSGLAKGWALHGEPVLRGHLQVGYSTLYPLFAAPAFALAADGAGALGALKAMNAIAMASTAVPAYLLARRALARGWALGVAALSVGVPWTAYAALTLTESLFYPVFVAYAAALAWTLEHPTWRRQAVGLVLLVVLVGVRTQGLAVVAGTVLAILVYGFVGAGVPATARRFVPTLAALAAAAVALLLAKAAGVAVPTSTYNAVFESLSRLAGMLKWAAWNVASFELALGVVAVAAFPLALRAMLRTRLPAPVRSAAAVALALSLSVVASVALLSASPYGLDRLHERSLFYVTPLLLTCFAYWLSHGLERRRWLTLSCAVSAVALAAALPKRLVFGGFHVDVPSAVFFRDLDLAVSGVEFRVWALAIAIVGAGTLLFAKRALFPALSVILAFAAVTARVDYADRLTGGQARALSWVDHSLPTGARATLVHLGLAYSIEPCASAAWWEEEHLVVWTEWFNTRIDAVKYLYQPNQFDGVPSGELTTGEGGLVLDAGRPFEPDYVIIDSRQRVTGIPVARFELDSIQSEFRNGASLTLWRVDPPLRLYDRPVPFPPRGNGRQC
jgi:hypothetical protein